MVCLNPGVTFVGVEGNPVCNASAHRINSSTGAISWRASEALAVGGRILEITSTRSCSAFGATSTGEMRPS